MIKSIKKGKTEGVIKPKTLNEIAERRIVANVIDECLRVFDKYHVNPIESNMVTSYLDAFAYEVLKEEKTIQLNQIPMAKKEIVINAKRNARLAIESLKKKKPAKQVIKQKPDPEDEDEDSESEDKRTLETMPFDETNRMYR